MYKVFIHNKPVEVINFEDKIEQIENTLILRYYDLQDIDSVLSILEQVPTIAKVILLAENPSECMEALKKNLN